MFLVSSCLYIYISSPVNCLEYEVNNLIVKTVGGKLEIRSPISSDPLHSILCHEDAITSIVVSTSLSVVHL